MKRFLVLVLIMSAIFLTGCKGLAKSDMQGNEWSESWIELGMILGVEEPAGNFTFLEANDAVALNGISYASWISGEQKTYINSESEEVTLYDTEAYVLLKDFSDSESAKAAVEEWKGLEEISYTLSEGKTITCSGQEFIFYELAPIEESPYYKGIAAFSVYNNTALSVEMMFQEESVNGEKLLKSFLESFHYRAVS